MRCHAPDTSGHQPFPASGSRGGPLDPTLDDLIGFGKSSDTLYSYIIATVKEEEGKFVQYGSAPNLQGGYVTLCTCKHRLRTFLDCDSWPGVWIAGCTGRCTGAARNDLVYLMRVGWAFASHRDLWCCPKLPASMKKSKAADLHARGDLFRPKSPGLPPHAPASYKPPITGHSHEQKRKWHLDISYSGASGWPAALLVGDPRLTCRASLK
jgi:hypothetical protein